MHSDHDLREPQSEERFAPAWGMFRHMKTSWALGASLLAISVGWASSEARAEDSVAAQALYDRAVELMGQKNYVEACPKLEEVTRLIPDGLGAKLTLAECYEADGKLASAWTQYSFVESSAARLNQAERQRIAGEKAAALKPKLAHLTIKVPDVVKKMPGLKVTRGGVPIGPAQFNEAMPIDKGSHALVATAEGKIQWTLDAKIPADGASLSVDVPVLEEDPKARLKDPVAGAGAGSGSPPPESKPTWLFPVGLAVGGVGVAGLAAGGALGGLAMSKSSDAEDACPSGRCTKEGNDLRLGAGTFADVSTALFIGGGVLAGAGILMVVLSPTVQGDAPADDKPKAALHFGPTGLFLDGSF